MVLSHFLPHPQLVSAFATLLLKTEEQQLALVRRQHAPGNVPTLALWLCSSERPLSYLVSCTGRNDNEPQPIEQFPAIGLMQPLLTPIPIASVSTTTAQKPGARANRRIATLMSCQIEPIRSSEPSPLLGDWGRSMPASRSLELEVPTRVAASLAGATAERVR